MPVTVSETLSLPIVTPGLILNEYPSALAVTKTELNIMEVIIMNNCMVFMFFYLITVVLVVHESTREDSIDFLFSLIIAVH